MKTIFVVDDDASLRKHFFSLLSKEYTVKLFSSAQICLENIRDIKPDLVITNLFVRKGGKAEIFDFIKKNKKLLAEPSNYNYN